MLIANKRQGELKKKQRERWNVHSALLNSIGRACTGRHGFSKPQLNVVFILPLSSLSHYFCLCFAAFRGLQHQLTVHWVSQSPLPIKHIPWGTFNNCFLYIQEFKWYFALQTSWYPLEITGNTWRCCETRRKNGHFPMCPAGLPWLRKNTQFPTCSLLLYMCSAPGLRIHVALSLNLGAAG